MWRVELRLFIVFVYLTGRFNIYTEEVNTNLCQRCIESKDTNCLLKTCQYEICDETTVDNAMQANESLLAPKIHCQDVNLLVFTWDATNDTLYFLEYSRNIQERNYTNLTADGHEILNGLLPDTDYIIKLTSLKVTESMFDTLVLRRSYPISIRTRKYPRTPLPVKSFEMCSIGSCHHENNTCTALVKWEPAEDKSCFYDIVLLENQSGSYRPHQITPLAPYEFNFTDLYFGESYSIGIRAISDENYRYESTPVWLNITVPTCLQQFKSLMYCTPETPENFQAEEVFRSANLLGNFPLYDIGMSWNKPNYTPDYYTVYLFDEGTNGVNNSSIILNVTGKETTAEYTNVALDTHYKIYLVAHSIKGPSQPAVYAGYINATAILLANESWISTEVVLLIVCPVIIIISVLLYAFIRLMAKKTQLDYFEEIDKTLPSIDYTITPVKESESLDAWELLEEKLLIKDVLGEGAFGVVRKGEYDLGEGKRTEVAIKMLKGNPDTEEKRQILQEINIMKSVPAHPHLVSLIGCITQGSLFGPLLVVEYCSKGDLHSYLRNILDKLHNPFYANQLDSIIIGEDIKCASNRLYDLAVLENNDIPQPKDLISYARQIAIGMEYLTSLKLIHRDLAARNVLISSDNTVKISDFGLSRDVYYDKVYCKTTRGKLPIRWMALESLTHQVYTSQSDVWSFGILLWEIVTLGSTPYPGLSTGELLVLLKDGYRMKKPSNCSDELYLIMSKCWKATPKERPTFTELRKALDDTLETISHYLDLNTSEASDISTCQNNKPRNTGSLERYVIQMKEV